MRPKIDRLAGEWWRGLLVLVVACTGTTRPEQSGEGLVAWSVPSGQPATFPFTPAASAQGDAAYFPTADYRLKKIAGDGRVLWDVNIGPVLTTPDWNAVLSGSVVAIPKVDIFAYDTTTGAPRWYHQLPAPDESGFMPLVSDETRIYAVSRLAKVIALDAAAGAVVWLTDLTGGRSPIYGLFPSLHAGQLFVCTSDNSRPPPQRGSLWALAAATGTVQWRHDFSPERPEQPSSCFGGAAIVQDLAVQPQEDGRVIAFDRVSGAVRWIAPRVHPLPGEGPTGAWGDQRWPAARGNDLIVTSTTGIIVSLDPATGRERWRARPSTASVRRPVVDGTTSYFDYGGGYVALETSTGRVLWWDPPGGEAAGVPAKLWSRAVIGRDLVFIGGRDGSYALYRR